MAELLVKAVDGDPHADPTKHLRGVYRRGDVIGVAGNGYKWGAKEGVRRPPAQGGNLVVIRISDVNRAQVLAWVRNNWACEVDQPDGVRKRRVKIDVDLLPAGVRSTLNQTGFFETTWAAVRDFVRNKLTNATATGASI